MSVTVTLHAWWLGAYLLVGAALFVPLNYVAWRRTTIRVHYPFWPQMLHAGWVGAALQVVAWPAAIWEVAR